MNEVKAYECEYCYKKLLHSKAGMASHEKKCFWNPKMRACMTCEHRDERDRTIMSNGQISHQEYLYCNKFNHELKRGTLKANCKYWEERELREWEL